VTGHSGVFLRVFDDQISDLHLRETSSEIPEHSPHISPISYCALISRDSTPRPTFGTLTPFIMPLPLWPLSLDIRISSSVICPGVCGSQVFDVCSALRNVPDTLEGWNRCCRWVREVSEVGQLFAVFAGERKNVLLQASVGAFTVSDCPQTLVDKRYVAWARVGAERIGDGGMRAGVGVVCKLAHFVESSYVNI
jgi:hypothetical protein